MFKKFKDKLAEEVKSSPQRLQQFAQAAQAAVTSASSSISDITNNDLFSIGDSDSGSKSQTSTASQQSTFRDVSPVNQGVIQSGPDLVETTMMLEESQRQRRLSTSSLASDISFRLPSYESTSMYHLQSDIEVSASEAEEKGFVGGAANLDRVTKEQLYSAYRRTYERCKKYKTQYADLARHYKLLERENAKAKNVLVETQDKALRRMSELREQCSLEQSAKAHLERALRIEIDEKNMKIHTLKTKLELLQENPENPNDIQRHYSMPVEKESEMHLINLNDIDTKQTNEESLSSEISVLNNKLEKMEQLMNKYKESLKVVKEKNSQMSTEIQILSSDLQIKSKENEDLKSVSASLIDSKKKIQELNHVIEELQNKCNTYEFTKNKETSILEINLQSAQEDILHLEKKIEELKKKEEEYAISLAENKLSIHKELESKEAEIKSLKDSLSEAQNEIQSLQIVIDDYKNNIAALESERLTLNNDVSEYNVAKIKIKDMEVQVEEIRQKCHSLENSKAKLDEQYKCLQLQMKQETAEKLAMIDRNTYLESRNAQLAEENAKKCSQIHDLENMIESHCNNKKDEKEAEINSVNEISLWKTKYQNLEKEIQEEREELIKLQSEIEKLLRNYELVQVKNMELIKMNSDLKKENLSLQDNNQKIKKLVKNCNEVKNKVKELREFLNLISNDSRSCRNFINNEILSVLSNKILLFHNTFEQESIESKEKYNELKVNCDLSEKELKNISNKYKVTLKELQILNEENTKNKLEIEKYSSDIIDMEKKLQNAAKQHEMSMEEISALKSEIDSLKNRIEINGKHHISIDENIKSLERENHNLQDKLKDSEISIQSLNTYLNTERESKEIMQNIAQQYEFSQIENTSLKKELVELKQKIENHEKESMVLRENLKDLETENRNVQDKLADCQNIIQLLNLDLKKVKELDEEKNKEIDALSTKNTSLIKEQDDKKKYIFELEENIENLTQENLTLKNLSETISVNVNELESEMNEVRKSHEEIEREKNHLSSIIEQLEKNQLKECSSVDSKLFSPLDFLHQEQKQEEKNDDIKNDAQEVKKEDTNIVSNVPHSNKFYDSDKDQKYCSLQNEYEVLKEENRRLQSDVEGLQIYLTKISKENGILNDKLREYIASGEHVPDKNESLYHDIEELKSEIQSGKEIIENLMRENTILVEENLELKDQIQSQSYNSYSENKSIHINNNTEQELQGFKDKYNSLLDVKTKLEKRLNDVEQVNESVTANMNQMQINNEKLRLSNEKLERRLDEALVSLRHLHSLQENTELEYLRNILYEYLTGSGTHSLTLAKVLAAVVKFNDSQTDIVLQKERERQGFLRQMGLL